MKKVFKIGLFVLGNFFTLSSAFAMNYSFQSGPPVDYKLPPQDPQVFSNVFMWPVKATCTIQTDESQVDIGFKVLRKKGSVNNMSMSAGDTLQLTFYPNQKVTLTAEPGGKVELTNLSSSTVNARCYSE